VILDCTNIHKTRPDPKLVREMRASYYLMGALLSRIGMANVALPGGCNFASRPIDQHIKGFRALGAEVEETEDYVNLKPGPFGLQGNRISLDVVSVGATVNIMLAATLLPGQTVIENAAKEPHIVDLANFLNTMGARISGAGTDTVKIRGVESLQGGTYAIIPDQIEAGTYLAAVAAAGGNVLVKNVIPKHMECITSKLQEMGTRVINYDDCIRILSDGQLRYTTVKTRPYPGFPTDMQAQICVCMAVASGVSRLTENVYETRFFGYCTELQEMGADILINGKTAIVTGGRKLHGVEVSAHDLRAGAALIIAGLTAEGTTVVQNAHFVERGYENIVAKLAALGAEITRLED
jgi:UDP-N-acetylglucosamine 1-carboxyvinyltransferase